MADFDIIRYMSGLTSFVFDKAVFERIALDRGVVNVSSYDELTKQQRDLLYADILFTAWLSPDVIGSISVSHGGFSKSVGSQTVENRDRLYNIFMGIYRRYDDDKLEEVEANMGGTLQWL